MSHDLKIKTIHTDMHTKHKNTVFLRPKNLSSPMFWTLMFSSVRMIIPWSEENPSNAEGPKKTRTVVLLHCFLDTLMLFMCISRFMFLKLDCYA